jgi:hypothetical protein
MAAKAAILSVSMTLTETRSVMSPLRRRGSSISTGGTTLLASSTNALATGSWNFVEVKLTIADSGGVFEVRVNESVWVTFTGDTKQSSSQTTANRILFSSRSTDCGFDDLYICDGTGSVNNTYLGDVRIDTVRPTGAGNYTEFGHQGSSNNWDNVDDTTIDSDSSYNYSNTVGNATRLIAAIFR